MNQLIHLLICPVCNRTLSAPTTLQCGHSICSHHSTVCCPQNPQPPAPNIPAHSRINFNPAPSAPLTTLSLSRASDVTLTSILALVQRQNEDGDDRPRKRRKRHQSPDDGGDGDLLTHLRNAAAHQRSTPLDVPLIQDSNFDNGDGDLLTHLCNAAAHQRSTPLDVPLIQDPPPDFDKKLLEELTCHICYVLFYRPVTTPCQHTFCSKCLQRSLDYGSNCPICRQEIPAFYFQDHPLNETIMNIILKVYPTLYQERADAIEQEERLARLNTPIFVCQLSFPGVPTVLHFFEPRYRLMLRRCLESPTPFFGMIMPPKAGCPPVDYGTILDIRSVQMLPDGRSIVETWGSTRFRILERGFLDGYMVGRIERIYDYRDDLTLVLDGPTPQPLLRRIASLLHQDQDPPVASSSSVVASSTSIFTSSTPATSSASASTSSSSSFASASSSSASSFSASSSSASSSSASSSSASSSSASSSPAAPASSTDQPTNDQLMDTCKAFLDRLQRGAAPWVVQRLSSTYGTMPTDPGLFSFWVALVLPIDDREKAKLLPIKSARLRLMMVVHWIDQLNSKWWFSSGCTIL